MTLLQYRVHLRTTKRWKHLASYVVPVTVLSFFFNIPMFLNLKVGVTWKPIALDLFQECNVIVPAISYDWCHILEGQPLPENASPLDNDRLGTNPDPDRAECQDHQRHNGTAGTFLFTPLIKYLANECTGVFKYLATIYLHLFAVQRTNNVREFRISGLDKCQA